MDFIQYLISFLLGEENKSLVSLVSYGNPTPFTRIVIEASNFFDSGVYLTEKSLPVLPLPELDGIPVLFGSPSVREEEGILYIGADLLASAFFLLSRYEECVRREVRDQHGRFPGRESLPYRAGFLHRPVLDEYGALLRKFLRQMGVNAVEPLAGFRRIWLTHDVDNIWTWDNYYRALRTVAKRVLTAQPDKLRPLYAYYDYQKYDPSYTFPWLIEMDDSVRTAYGAGRCIPLYFFMGCESSSVYDRGYLANRKRTGDLIRYLHANHCMIGYHVSYRAATDSSQIELEVSNLRKLSGLSVTLSRNHYLDSREPEDFEHLLKAGITDDFTMGYADIVGFRLGTCQPVQWIHPIRKEVTGLTLHHLTAMECTLDSPAYMNVQEEDTAFHMVRNLLQTIYAYGGETVLLWHNESVFPIPTSYRRHLYQRILELLLQLKDLTI